MLRGLTTTFSQANSSGLALPLADSAQAREAGETARSLNGGRQADFLETLGFDTRDFLGIGECEGDTSTPYRLGSTSEWLEDYHNRLDFIRVAKPLLDGRRLEHLEEVEDSTRRLVRQLGGNPWEN